ncbi:MAG: hypothetical protein ACQSGP_00195 [Frankia sp.]
MACDRAGRGGPPTAGLIGPERAVVGPAVRALAALVADRDGLDQLADAVRDPRIEPDRWRASFAREMVATLRWAVDRSRRASAGPGTPSAGAGRPDTAGGGPVSVSGGGGPGTVVALLPAHGVAVHLLRRAGPFALCGIPTVLGAHPHQVREVERVAAVLGDALGVSGVLASRPRPGRDAVARAGPGDLVVLTGAARTFPLIRRATRAAVAGACGGCAVAVGRDADQLRRLAGVLRTHDQPDSCTRWGGWWQGELSDPTWRRPDGSVVVATEALAAAHPSVVYNIRAELPGEPGSGAGPVVSVHGYGVLPCDPAGRVVSLRGFGRDPGHGWPGDFVV